jgi:hypothetical protein
MRALGPLVNIEISIALTIHFRSLSAWVVALPEYAGW